MARTALVFFDDSVFERELVRSLLPEVTVVEGSRGRGQVPRYNQNLVEFDSCG